MLKTALATFILLYWTVLSVSPVFGQTTPPPDPTLPAPVWSLSVEEFLTLMQNPTTEAPELIRAWQTKDGLGDHHTAEAITFFAQQSVAKIDAMTTAINSLTAAVALQTDAQLRIADTLDEAIVLSLKRLRPNRTAVQFPVDINDGNPNALMDVPGIGPGLAAEIVRQAPFATVADLLSLPNVTQSKLDKISPNLAAIAP